MTLLNGQPAGANGGQAAGWETDTAQNDRSIAVSDDASNPTGDLAQTLDLIMDLEDLHASAAREFMNAAAWHHQQLATLRRTRAWVEGQIFNPIGRAA